MLLYIADKFENNKKIETDLKLKTILIIGVFQILALIPGVSRSGIVITAGRFLNFSRYDSTKISFYLSIPAIAGASFLSLKNLFDIAVDNNCLDCFKVIVDFCVVKTNSDFMYRSNFDVHSILFYTASYGTPQLLEYLFSLSIFS